MINQALQLYDLKQPETEFIRHNENMTYKITDGDKKYLLRIHKSADGFSSAVYSDYSQIEMIRNEIEIISTIKYGTTILIQTPIIGKNGNFVQDIDGIPVTLLEWIEGENAETVEMTSELLFNGGKMIAEMHNFLASHTNIKYSRCSYDQTILPKIAAGIKNAVRLDIIKLDQAKIIFAALDEIRIRFGELDNMYEKHIIHADLNKSNIIVDKNGRLVPIDFSLCGYGHFYMDINMFNGDTKFSREIIEGYKSVRNVEIVPRYMEPYVALGIILFVGAQYERALKDFDWFPNSVERWCRDIFKPFADGTEFITL